MYGVVVSLSDRLKMLPSEFRARANSLDIAEMLALDMVRDEKWRTRYEQSLELEQSRKKTDAQRAADIDKLVGL